MDGAVTICNMWKIEGGARVGYVTRTRSPCTTCGGKKYAPQGEDSTQTAWWLSLASDAQAAFDDEVRIDAAAIRPRVTWGDRPGGQWCSVDERRCRGPPSVPSDERTAITEALDFMGFGEGAPIKGTRSTWRSSGRGYARLCKYRTKPPAWSAAIAGRD